MIEKMQEQANQASRFDALAAQCGIARHELTKPPHWQVIKSFRNLQDARLQQMAKIHLEDTKRKYPVRMGRRGRLTETPGC